MLLLSPLAPRWVLTLDQTFDGKAGTVPNPAVWGRDLGPARQNNELQTYTDGNANAFLDGKGRLVIEARKEPKDGREYTSARLKTQGKFEQRYGRFEARMRMPLGHGIWPAFWMLGADIDRVGWPRCGEIDILENIGRDPTGVYGTLHGPDHSDGTRIISYFGGAGISKKTVSDTLSTRFHDYAVEWEPERITWYFDGKPFHTVSAEDVGNKEWPFEKPQFVILNLAVGGGFPGNPDGTTVFPQRFVIDHVKVWRDANLKVDEVALARRRAERMARKVVFRLPDPSRLPGIVRLADYLPGEGVGFHDSDANNEGGAYRADGVDLGASGLGDTPWSIGWTKAGEWTTYAVDVDATGNYDVEVQTASDGPGGRIALDVDGKRAGAATVPNTGGWSNWRGVSMGRVGLTKGRHTLKLLMESAGPGGSVGNVATLRFTKV